MKYSKITVDNKYFIKRFSHNQRFIFCENIIKKYKFKKLLDYGSGDGYLIKILSKNFKKSVFHIYEPDKNMILEIRKNLRGINKKIFFNRKKLKKNSYDIVCVNEVFEHLSYSGVNESIKILKKILNKNGILIISVPIEVGLAGFLKNLIRYLINQKHSNTNIKNVIKSLLYLKIKRPNLEYNESHIGFNYLSFIKMLKQKGINITKISFSPFGFFGGLINSQVYIEARFK